LSDKNDRNVIARRFCILPPPNKKPIASGAGTCDGSNVSRSPQTLLFITIRCISSPADGFFGKLGRWDTADLGNAGLP
jgi:hypothetical protein